MKGSELCALCGKICFARRCSKMALHIFQIHLSGAIGIDAFGCGKSIRSLRADKIFHRFYSFDFFCFAFKKKLRLFTNKRKVGSLVLFRNPKIFLTPFAFLADAAFSQYLSFRNVQIVRRTKARKVPIKGKAGQKQEKRGKETQNSRPPSFFQGVKAGLNF